MKNESTRPTYDMASCGLRIRQLRKANGYTQEELAELLEIDRSFLSRIEAGAKGCSVDLFISLDHLILGRTPEQTQLRQELHTLIGRLTELEHRL